MTYQAETLLDGAIQIACHYHAGQIDKIGKPYIMHPLHVMLDPELETEEERTLAVLHDVLEDTQDDEDLREIALLDITSLFDEHNCPKLLGILKLLTHKPGTRYEDYISKIYNSHDLSAIAVKLADIQHNMSEERLKYLPKEDQERLRDKYTRALATLQHGP
jgi:GTP diphosphokinase / guanosine-3',5'-bis(diphosphate) 3'-diphosphatase